MYRNFLKKTLNRDQLKEINRNAPENVKFCNGICQDFRDKTNFSGAHVICNNCRNSINLADKQVKEGKITIDEFKENPDIVDGIEVVFDSNKTCSVCKQEKNISQFESNKNQCKACRSIQANERINKDIEILISDIEKTKNNLTSLEKFVRDISKDKLIKIISHFQVGRKATDTKERMVYNVVEHFRKLLNPLLCQGGCGYTLKEEFSYCGECKNKKSRAINKKMDFEDNFDDIIENIKTLPVIEEKDYDKYTRNQYLKISDKLDIKGLNTKSKKQEIIDKINEFLKKNNDENQKILKETLSEENIEKENQKLELNGFIVLSREDGFINATALCKAGGKKFNDWFRLDSTKELIKEFEAEILNTHNPVFKSMEIEKGRYGGSWIHPDLAVQLAQWISPTFALKVSKWVREIAITGGVRIGQEKTDTQLNALQNKIKEDENKFKLLEKKHKNILQKRQYYKFKQGPVFYIINTKEGEYKVGFEGVDINERLRSYRTLIPDFKIQYLAYTENAYLLEQNMLSRFKSLKLEANHEVITGFKIAELIESSNTLISFCNFDAYIVSKEELSSYNDS